MHLVCAVPSKLHLLLREDRIKACIRLTLCMPQIQLPRAEMWAGKSQCWNFCLRSIFCSRMFISSWVAVSCITNMPAKELLRPGHGICRLKNICIHVQGFMSLPAIAHYEAKLPRSWVSAITLCKARLPKSRVSCAFAFDMQHHIKFWCSCCFTKKKNVPNRRFMFFQVPLLFIIHGIMNSFGMGAEGNQTRFNLVVWAKLKQ